MVRRAAITGSMTVVFVLAGTLAAYACGGLIGPNGTVQLVRTSTLVAYTGGVEHYVTSFQYAGAQGNFGSIVPLPGRPSDVQRGGKWTLQRLQKEIEPPPPPADRTTFAQTGRLIAGGAEVLFETQIDALDISVLRGGAEEVVIWAEGNGYELSDDTPEVLGFYAERSPYFLAARFDADAAAARGQTIGQGTPIHVTIPTDDPWVPLRILALGKGDVAPVEADVFILTEQRPAIVPGPADLDGSTIKSPALRLIRDEWANIPLLDDLRSDDGMAWLPRQMWFTALRVDGEARAINFDLAISARGGSPSLVDAGFGELFVNSARNAEVLWRTMLLLTLAVLVLRRVVRGPAHVH